MKVLAATNNPGKVKELKRILEAQGHEMCTPRSLGISLDPEETGTTFEENAAIKAAAFSGLTGLPVVADDSGLCVDALNGAPGVFSARYFAHGDDEGNNDKLLANMADVPAGKRSAKFVSCICFRLPNGAQLICRGECPGSIAPQRLIGNYGFGYDPLFVPDACGLPDGSKRPNSEGRSYAQLTPDEKDAISHRGRAMEQLAERLSAFLAENGYNK